MGCQDECSADTGMQAFQTRLLLCRDARPAVCLWSVALRSSWLTLHAFQDAAPQLQISNGPVKARVTLQQLTSRAICWAVKQLAHEQNGLHALCGFYLTFAIRYKIRHLPTLGE